MFSCHTITMRPDPGSLGAVVVCSGLGGFALYSACVGRVSPAVRRARSGLCDGVTAGFCRIGVRISCDGWLQPSATVSLISADDLYIGCWSSDFGCSWAL